MFTPKTALYAFVVVTSLAVAACQPTERPTPPLLGPAEGSVQQMNDQADRTVDDVNRIPPARMMI